MTDIKKEFDKFLVSNEKKAKPEIDWEKRKTEWLEKIDDLYNNINNWLSDYTESSRIELKYIDYPMFEEALGSYMVKKLEIKLGDQVATIEPIGTILIGARGRADLSGRKGKIKFVLTDKNISKPKITVRIIGTPEEEKKREEELAKLPKEQIDWVWKISTNPPNITYTDLTQETFLNSIIKVING